MKKKIYTLIFLNILTIVTIAQSNIRFNNDWNKTYIVNPASINDRFLGELNMAIRHQWVGFEGAPKSLFVSGALNLDNLYRSQFGLKILQDKIGFSSTTDIGLTYAYSILVQSNWRLNMGLGLNFQSLGYDVSEIHSPTPSDPAVLSRLLRENNMNSDLGFELSNKIWRLGISSQNMFSLFGQINKLFLNTNYIYAIHREYNPSFMNLGYGICGIQYANLYQMQFNLTGYFKSTTENEPFQLSLTYRTWSEIGALFGFDLSRNLWVSYSFDCNLTGISRNSYGTHEFMITWKLDKPSKCRNCWYENTW